MMYVIFNQDGSTKTQNLGEFIQQGSSNYNSIFVSVIGASNYSVSGYCTLPNSSTLTISGVASTKTIEGVSYEGYLITLTAQSLVYSGDLLMAISCVKQSQVLITYPITLTINATGVNDNTSLNITNGQLNGYQANLSAKQNTYSANNFRSYADTTALTSDLSNLAEGQIVYVNSTKRFYKKHNEAVDEIVNPFFTNGSGIRMIANELSVDTNTIQSKLTAGTGIAINNNVISATGEATITWGVITGNLQNQTDLKNALDGKQATLTFDNAPTSGSDNPVKSGGIYTAIQNVREIAEGKCKSYVLKHDTSIASVKSNLQTYPNAKVYDVAGNDITASVRNGLYDNYVIENNIFNSQDEYVSPTDIDNYFITQNPATGYPIDAIYIIDTIANFMTVWKNGDNFYITNFDVPDRWYAGLVVTSPKFYILETKSAVTLDTTQTITGAKTFTEPVTITDNIDMSSGSYLVGATYTYEIDELESNINKVQTVSSQSTDDQYPSAACLYTALQTKQDTLTSGTNIKTINNTTLLGSGNINTKELPTISSGDANKVLKVNVGETGVEWGTSTPESIITQTTGGTSAIYLKFWKGTQAQYDSIVTKDESTLYVIVG